MRTKDIIFFKDVLQRELSTLTEKANLAVGEQIHGDTEIEPDPVDQATLQHARDQRLRFHNRESRLIGKIKRCLETIEEGTYGICEGCEEPIALARLKARPVTSYCIDCKTQQEVHERLTGS